MIDKYYDNQEQLTEELRVNVAQESAKKLLEGIEELARSVAHDQANKLAEAGYISKDNTKRCSLVDRRYIYIDLTHLLNTGSGHILSDTTDYVMNILILEPEIEAALNELPEAPTEDEEAATIAERQWEEDTGR